MQPLRIELPTGLDVGSVNVYLFTEPEPVLVDTGLRSDESWEALQLGLAAYGLTVLDLSRVVITHAHVDHYGQAGTITANSDADVWISDLGASWLLMTKAMWARRLRYYRETFLPSLGLAPEVIELFLAGFQAVASQSDAIPADRIHTFRSNGLLQLGGQTWRVLHTPGHASMQTVFYQPESRQLISADMLLAITPTPVVESPPEGETRRAPALPQYMHSLQVVESLDVDMVYPGHGRPFRNHHEVIQRQRERIVRRKAECLDWITAGNHTPLELLEKMYAHRSPQTRFAGLWMLLGYLDLLEAEGLVTKQKFAGVWHYRQNVK